MSDRVLVTGGAGYIGSHIVYALLDAGRHPVIVDNLSTGSRQFVPIDVPFLEANVSDASQVRAFIQEHGCHSAIHLAGSIDVEESMQDPLGYYQNNTCASHAFIQSCVTAGIRYLIFSSTAAVYGEPEEARVTEMSRTKPVSPYGWSKLMTERMLSDVGNGEDLTTISLRYFNVAGADPQGRCGMTTKNATHLIKVLCETALGVREFFNVFGEDYDTPDGTCVRDFIHVSDLAQAHVAALDYLVGGNPSAIFNCGYGSGYSVKQVVDTAQKLCSNVIDVRSAPRREGDIVTMVANVDKMRANLDWKPKFDDLDVIVQSSLDWERRLRCGAQ